MLMDISSQPSNVTGSWRLGLFYQVTAHSPLSEQSACWKPHCRILLGCRCKLQPEAKTSCYKKVGPRRQLLTQLLHLHVSVSIMIPTILLHCNGFHLPAYAPTRNETSMRHLPAHAPMARPAMRHPSIRWCGSCLMISRSLHVPGSPSSPFTTR